MMVLQKWRLVKMQGRGVEGSGMCVLSVHHRLSLLSLSPHSSIGQRFDTRAIIGAVGASWAIKCAVVDPAGVASVPDAAAAIKGIWVLTPRPPLAGHSRGQHPDALDRRRHVRDRGSLGRVNFSTTHFGAGNKIRGSAAVPPLALRVSRLMRRRSSTSRETCRQAALMPSFSSSMEDRNSIKFPSGCSRFQRRQCTPRIK